MTASEVKAAAWGLMGPYFEHLAEKLNSTDLEDVLAHADPYLLCLGGVGQAAEIVERLLRETMHPFEEGEFSQLLASLRSQVGVNSEVMLMQLLRDYTDIQRIAYEGTWSRTLNRLSLSFLNEYLLLDGRIDWEKLVRCTPHAGNKGMERC